MPGKQAFVVGEVGVEFERFAEHKEDLVSVQDAHPFRPWIVYRPLGEIIRVDVASGLRVTMSELVERTDELTVADSHVKRVDVLIDVVEVQPVGVLELQRQEHIGCIRTTDLLLLQPKYLSLTLA